MVIEVRPALGHWLVDQGVVPKRVLNTAKQSGKGMVQLDGKISALVENGIKVFQLLEALSNTMGVPVDVSVSALQHQHSPVAKLYNWNVLSQTLATFNVPLDADMKALIVAGDTEVIVDVLEQLMQLEKSTNKDRGGDGGYQGINRTKQASMNSVNGKSPAERGFNRVESERRESNISGARTWVEFMSAVFASRLQIGEKQASGLVQGSPEYFQRLCRHGMNGNVTAVSRSFQDMFNGGKKLAALLGKDPRTLPQALSMLKFGLMSSSADVAVWAARLLAKIGQEFRTVKAYSTLWEWFVTETEGLDACVECHRLHGGLKGALFQVIDSFSYGHLHDLLVEDMRRNISNPMEYLVFIPSLFPHLAGNRVCKDAIVAMGTIDNIVDFALKFTDSNAPNNTRLAAVEAVTEAWMHFPDLVELRTDTTRQILALMKKNCRDSNIQLQIASITCLYTLLDFFTEQRNAFAPVVYKTLIFSLIENHGDEFMRNYIMTNMMITLDKTPNIPVGVMLDPLLKQVTMHGYHNLDFDFFLTLSKHPKLDLRYSLQFLELLGRIVLTDTLHSRLATVPFLIILNRFGMATEIVDFTETFTKRALAAFMDVAPAAQGLVASTRTATDLDTDAALSATILEAIAKIGHLGNSSINPRVHALLLDAVKEFAESYGQEHDGLRSIVRYFGDDSAINNDLTMFTKRPPSQRGFAMAVGAPDQPEPTSSRSSVVTEHLEDPKTITSKAVSPTRGGSPERAKARQLAAKRQRDIEKVKQRRLARLEKQRQEEERRRLKSARIKKRMKEYREKVVMEFKNKQVDDDDVMTEDPDLLARLNEELLYNPEMEMPPGYIKVKVSDDYVEPKKKKTARRSSRGDTSEAIATWALDSIMYDALEIHIAHDAENENDGSGDDQEEEEEEEEEEGEDIPKRIYEAKYDHAGAKARESRKKIRGRRASGSETESPEPGGRASRVSNNRPPESFDDKKHFASRCQDLALKYPDAKERANAVFMMEILDTVVDEVLGDIGDGSKHARQVKEVKPSRGLEQLNEKKKKEEMEFKMKEVEREKKRKKRMEESRAKLEEYNKKKAEAEEQRKEEEQKLKFAAAAAKEKEKAMKEQRKKEQAARLEEWQRKKKEEDEEKARIEKEQKKKLAEDKKKMAEDYEKRAKEREERERKKAEEKAAKKAEEDAANKRKKSTVAPAAKGAGKKAPPVNLKKQGTTKAMADPPERSPINTQRSNARTETFVAPDGKEEEMEVAYD